MPVWRSNPRSPFVYPSGVAPRFNRPALLTAGPIISAVASGGNMVSLETARAGIMSGTPLPSWGIDGTLGPVANFTNSSNYISYAWPATNNASATYATIFRMPPSGASGGNTQYICTTYNNGDGIGIGLNGGDNVSYLDSGAFNNIIVAPDVPYSRPVFIAVSRSTTLGITNWVVTDLSNGQIRSGSGSAGGAGGSETLFNIGNRQSSDRPLVGGIAAVMMSHATDQTHLLSIAELRQWARDPWSLWYPQQQPLYVAVSAAVVNYTLTAATGSFTLSGTATNLVYARTMPAAIGAFALSGKAATLRVGHTVTAALGSFALSGSAVALRVGRSTALATGSFVLSGYPVGLNYSTGAKKLIAAPGAFALNGTVSALRLARVLSVIKGAIVVSGSTTALVRGRPLVAGTGAFALTGLSVNFVAHRAIRLVAQGTQVDLSGRVAFLGRSGTEQPGRIEFGTRVWLRAW